MEFGLGREENETKSFWSSIAVQESFPFQRKGWWLGKLLPLESEMAKLKDLAVSLTPFITNTPDRSARVHPQVQSPLTCAPHWPALGAAALLHTNPWVPGVDLNHFPLEAVFCVRPAAELSPLLVREDSERRQAALPAQILLTQPLAPALCHFLAPKKAETPTSKGHTQSQTQKPQSRQHPLSDTLTALSNCLHLAFSLENCHEICYYN